MTVEKKSRADVVDRHHVASRALGVARGEKEQAERRIRQKERCVRNGRICRERTGVSVLGSLTPAIIHAVKDKSSVLN